MWTNRCLPCLSHKFSLRVQLTRMNNLKSGSAPKRASCTRNSVERLHARALTHANAVSISSTAGCREVGSVRVCACPLCSTGRQCTTPELEGFEAAPCVPAGIGATRCHRDQPISAIRGRRAERPLPPPIIKWHCQQMDVNKWGSVRSGSNVTLNL